MEPDVRKNEEMINGENNTEAPVEENETQEIDLQAEMDQIRKAKIAKALKIVGGALAAIGTVVVVILLAGGKKTEDDSDDEGSEFEEEVDDDLDEGDSSEDSAAEEDE